MGCKYHRSLKVSGVLVVALGLVFVSCKSRKNASSGKGIFGADDRKDIFEVSDPALVRLSESVPALIEDSKLNLCGDHICSQKLSNYYPLGVSQKASTKKSLCPDERFSGQPNTSFCSGVLVAKNIIATAGHCLEGFDIATMTVVFNYGYQKSEVEGRDIILGINQVYKPIEILASQNSYDSKTKETEDYAFLLLDRDVEGRSPLEIENKYSDLKVGSKIVGIGYPDGLPQKIDTAGEIRNITESMILGNWDSMKGSSGEPLFSLETKKLVAINTAGQAFSSYQYSKERDCMETTKLREIDDELSNTGKRLDFVFTKLPVRVQKAILGTEAISSPASKFKPMTAGVEGTVASKTDLTPNPDFYNALGEVSVGDRFEVLDPVFIRYDLRDEKTSYAYLYIKVKMLSGEYLGKTGYIRSEVVKW